MEQEERSNVDRHQPDREARRADCRRRGRRRWKVFALIGVARRNGKGLKHSSFNATMSIPKTQRILTIEPVSLYG